MVKGILLLIPTFILLMVMLMLFGRCGIRGRKGPVAEFASMKAQEFEADHHRLPTEDELKAEMRSAWPHINLEPEDHILIFWTSDGDYERVPGYRGLTIILRSNGEEIKTTELVMMK